jgi:HEAT repeat protein
MLARGFCHALMLGVVAWCAACSPTPSTQAHGKPVSHWVEVLQSPDAKARKKAVDVLSNVGTADPAVLPALTEAVKDRDVAVRRAAILALLKMGPAAKDATPALTEALQDKDPQTREYARKALEKIQE